MKFYQYIFFLFAIITKIQSGLPNGWKHPFCLAVFNDHQKLYFPNIKGDPIVNMSTDVREVPPNWNELKFVYYTPNKTLFIFTSRLTEIGIEQNDIPLEQQEGNNKLYPNRTIFDDTTIIQLKKMELKNMHHSEWVVYLMSYLRDSFQIKGVTNKDIVAGEMYVKDGVIQHFDTESFFKTASTSPALTAFKDYVTLKTGGKLIETDSRNIGAKKYTVVYEKRRFLRKNKLKMN